MYACESYERFFLILERFLMCCGQYKNELLKQHKVNSQLVEISTLVERKLDVEKVSKKETIEIMHQELCKAEVRIKLWQQLIIQHAKFDDGRRQHHSQLLPASNS